MIGAEAIRELLKDINLDELIVNLKLDLHEQKSEQTKRKILKRLKIIEAFKKSGNRPDPDSTTVTLTALPAVGYKFDYWELVECFLNGFKRPVYNFRVCLSSNTR